ncbi:ArsA family ATPase [uncultured Microscilla sp.]|uniref:ArsA family ATPase n=1 Tax=uncultured Microscilla sp. TaxID=432653 RepID=UPI002626C6CB|nr:ArsA family ATPase [uncultured Microscilla sp.]
MRILLYTGKGGVGKTTIAAATAVKTAEMGYKTLVISTDPAHSLSDALDVKLQPEPTLIRENLYGQELDVYYSMKKYWGQMREMLLAIFKLQGVNRVVAEEMSALPGMEEASAFLWIDKYYEEKAFDVVIIDSAPTGETLTLLTIPQVSQWWLSKAFPFQKYAVKAVGSMVRGFTGIPLDKGYEELDELFNKLQKVQKLMSNPEICSIRLVVNPERMVIKEAKRAYTYLQMYGYPVDSVVINRIFPEMEANSVFHKYIQSQKKYLQTIEESFDPLPIAQVKHLGEEVFGIDLLKTIATLLYPDSDPSKPLYNESPFQIIENGSRYLLKIHLPFVEEDSEDLSVTSVGQELIIQLGNQRRNFFVPNFLSFYTMEKHTINDGWLVVFYKKKVG